MFKTIFIALGALILLSIFLIVDPFGIPASAAGDKRGGKLPAASQPARISNFDVLSTVEPRESARQLPEMEGGRMVQKDTRFDVPTFMWASDAGEARPMRRGTAERREDQVSAAKSHLSRYAGNYRLTKADILNTRVIGIHDTGRGAIIVQLGQSLGGVEVFRDEVKIVMNRDLQLVAISGYLTGDNTADASPSRSFNLRPEDALSKALADLTGKTADASLFQQAGDVTIKGRLTMKTEKSPYTRFTAQNSALPGFALSDEPSRTNLSCSTCRIATFRLTSSKLSSWSPLTLRVCSALPGKICSPSTVIPT